MKKNEHVTRRNGITELTEQGVDDLLEHIEEDMDQSFMRSGKTLAELFRSVCIAALKLPNLELHTELMCVINDENSLTVIVHRDEAEAKSDENADDSDGMNDYSNYDNYDEEEEERLYDGD